MFCVSQQDVALQAVLSVSAMANHDKEKEDKMDVYEQEALAGNNCVKCHCSEDSEVMDDMKDII